MQDDYEQGLEQNIGQDMNQNTNQEESDGLTPNQAYSSKTCDINEEKRLVKKGRFQGFIITFVAMSVIFLICAIIILGAYIINTGNYSFIYGGSSDSVLTKKTEKKLDLLQSVIEKRYLNDYTKEDLENGLYKGLMQGLNDPYSVYYTEEEYAQLTEDTEGVFEGIGAYLSQDPETMVVTVVRPIKNSPAEEVGIKAGDIIIEVDHEDVVGDDINVTVAKIRGKAGTTVNIGVTREGRDGVIRFDIVRAKVESETIYSEMLEDSIGYIQIAEFDDVTASQFINAIDELEREEMTGLIIDLRDNPGGNVDTCVDIADRLLPEGEVVYMIEKNGRRTDYTSDAEHFYDGPMVVLVNGNSASASEILVGAIKDYKAATVLGTTTYGKGIVQEVMSLGDGTGMKVTIAKYYTPNDVCIHGTGIEPDEELELDVEQYLKDGIDNQKERAIEIIKSQIK